jgi:hypothetical protein
MLDSHRLQATCAAEQNMENASGALKATQLPAGEVHISSIQ